MRRPWRQSRLAALALVAAPLLAPGCALQDAASGHDYRLASLGEGRVLEFSPDLVVYRANDESTADFFLSDLPESALEPGGSLGGASGNLVHVHLFMRPRAGRTPIDSTAMTAAVTHVVVASGEVGVYTGGGFFRPQGQPDGGPYGAAVQSGSLRLHRQTAGFRDLLGASRLDASFRARRDEELAERLSRRVAELAQRGQAVREASAGDADEINAPAPEATPGS